MICIITLVDPQHPSGKWIQIRIHHLERKSTPTPSLVMYLPTRYTGTGNRALDLCTVGSGSVTKFQPGFQIHNTAIVPQRYWLFSFIGFFLLWSARSLNWMRAFSWAVWRGLPLIKGRRFLRSMPGTHFDGIESVGKRAYCWDMLVRHLHRYIVVLFTSRPWTKH